jgi:hypothetical protein
VNPAAAVAVTAIEVLPGVAAFDAETLRLLVPVPGIIAIGESVPETPVGCELILNWRFDVNCPWTEEQKT